MELCEANSSSPGGAIYCEGFSSHQRSVSNEPPDTQQTSVSLQAYVVGVYFAGAMGGRVHLK